MVYSSTGSRRVPLLWDKNWGYNSKDSSKLWECICLLIPTTKQDIAPCHKSHNLKLVSWKSKFIHCTKRVSAVTRSKTNRADLGYGGAGHSHHGCAVNKSATFVCCHHVIWPQSHRNASDILLNLCHKELRTCRTKRWIQTDTRQM